MANLAVVGQQVAVDGGHVDLAALAARRVDARIEGAREPSMASTLRPPQTSAADIRSSASNSPRSA